MLADVNLDMVGENTELLHSRLIVTENPFSIPSCVDDVVADMLAMVDGVDVRTPRGSQSAFHYRHTPYSGGSDHMMFIDRGIASVMLSHDPDYTHHTSEDTPDKVDPVELERCELLAAGTLWHLANLSEPQALDLAWLTSAGATARVEAAARRVRGWITEASPAQRAERAAAADSALAVCAQREQLALESVLDHYDRRDAAASPALARLVAEQCARLRSHVEAVRHALTVEFGDGTESARAPAELAAKGDARRVLRRTVGPLAFGLQERLLPAERVAWYATPAFPFAAGERRFELVNLANTGATLSEIGELYAAEFEPVDAADIARFFEDLESLGLVQLQKNQGD